ASASPGVFHAQLKIDMIDLMLHRQCDVVFSIERARDQSDRAARNQLANKDNAAPPSVRGFFSHIEAKVHFLEIAMERDRQSEQAGVEKKKAHDAEKCFPVFEIDFSPRRNQRRNDLWIDKEVGHGHVSPVGGEKW